MGPIVNLCLFLLGMPCALNVLALDESVLESECNEDNGFIGLTGGDAPLYTLNANSLTLRD